MEKVLDEKVDTMKHYLRERFGIQSEADLKKAITKTQKLNISIFVNPVKK